MGPGRWSGPRGSNVHNPVIRENPDPRQIRYQRPMPAIDPGLRPPGYMIPPRFGFDPFPVTAGSQRAPRQEPRSRRAAASSGSAGAAPSWNHARPSLSWSYASADRAASYIRTLVGAGSVRRSCCLGRMHRRTEPPPDFCRGKRTGISVWLIVITPPASRPGIVVPRLLTRIGTLSCLWTSAASSPQGQQTKEQIS